MNAETAQYRFQHDPVSKRDCVACHSGHGSAYPGNLSKGQPALCLGCHAEVAQYWRDGALHQPAAEDCTSCHNAHGSDQPGLMSMASGASSCTPSSGGAQAPKAGAHCS